MLTEKNNSKRLFKERTMIDARFELVVLGLAYFVSLEMKKDLTATEYFRSEEENTAVGGGKHSAHKVGRGGDFRSRLFTVSEKALIDNYLENVWGKDFLLQKQAKQWLATSINQRRHAEQVFYPFAKDSSTFS